MTDPSDEHFGNTARGDAAWKEATEEVAARNKRAQKLGREERDAYERARSAARRAAEVRADAHLSRSRDGSAPRRGEPAR